MSESRLLHSRPEAELCPKFNNDNNEKRRHWHVPATHISTVSSKRTSIDCHLNLYSRMHLGLPGGTFEKFVTPTQLHALTITASSISLPINNNTSRITQHLVRYVHVTS